MEDCFAALELAFTLYRQDLDNYAKKSRPTDGLLGFGRSLKDDPCHDRFDERVKEAVNGIIAASPVSEDAARIMRALLRDDLSAWPLAAQWMLRAVERHCIPLIPFLTPEAAAVFQQEYASRYKPWERLPVQQEIFKALKKRAAAEKKTAKP